MSATDCVEVVKRKMQEHDHSVRYFYILNVKCYQTDIFSLEED